MTHSELNKDIDHDELMQLYQTTWTKTPRQKVSEYPFLFITSICLSARTSEQGLSYAIRYITFQYQLDFTFCSECKCHEKILLPAATSD